MESAGERINGERLQGHDVEEDSPEPRCLRNLFVLPYSDARIAIRVGLEIDNLRAGTV